MDQPALTQPVGTAPRLTKRAEFEAALRDYQVSEEGRKVLAETPLVLLVGPTSTGRNTLINELVKTGRYYFLVSDTTRPPRQNNGVWEQNGREYYFRTEDEMLEDIRAGLFVEAEIIHNQQVSGTSIREIRKARDQGKVAVADVEILGALNIAKLKPDAWIICLVPPSLEEWLRRIHGRTPVSKEELRNRMETAIKIFDKTLDDDRFTFVVNVEKEDTVKLLEKMLTEGDHHNVDERAAREVAKRLWKDTEEYLKTLE
jgi:Guanylate kinase